MGKYNKKINSLQKEIAELQKKKSERDNFNELLAQRNRMKFAGVYKVGGIIKQLGKGAANSLTKFAKEEQKKQSKISKRSRKQDYDPFGFGI